MKRIILIASLLLAMTQTAKAYDETLKANSLICLSQPSMEEAVRAVDRSDVQWLRTLPCYLTSKPAKAQRIDCEWRTCKIRVWSGTGSAVVYTFRNGLS